MLKYSLAAFAALGLTTTVQPITVGKDGTPHPTVGEETIVTQEPDSHAEVITDDTKVELEDVDQDVELEEEEGEDDEENWQDQTDVQTLLKDVQDTLDIQLNKEEQETVESWNLDGLTRVSQKFDAQIFMYHNLFRVYPKLFIPYLKDKLTRFEGKMYRISSRMKLRTNEGAPAVQELIDFLKKQPSTPPQKWSENLAKASRDHVKDCGPSGKTGHTGVNGSSMKQRIQKHMKWQRTIGENIMYGSNKPLDVLISLAVDDGVRSRGHRTNIFNKNFVYIGMNSGYHKKYRISTVMNYSGSWRGVDIPIRKASVPQCVDCYKGYATCKM